MSLVFHFDLAVSYFFYSTTTTEHTIHTYLPLIHQKENCVRLLYVPFVSFFVDYLLLFAPSPIPCFTFSFCYRFFFFKLLLLFISIDQEKHLIDKTDKKEKIDINR
jgi:hypothetical protein